jgi:hypothetical protein
MDINGKLGVFEYRRRPLNHLEVSQLVDPHVQGLYASQAKQVTPMLTPIELPNYPGKPSWIYFDIDGETWYGIFEEEDSLKISAHTSIPMGTTDTMLQNLQDRVIQLEKAIEQALLSKEPNKILSLVLSATPYPLDDEEGGVT